MGEKKQTDKNLYKTIKANKNKETKKKTPNIPPETVSPNNQETKVSFKAFLLHVTTEGK